MKITNFISARRRTHATGPFRGLFHSDPGRPLAPLRWRLVAGVLLVAMGVFGASQVETLLQSVGGPNPVQPGVTVAQAQDDEPLPDDQQFEEEDVLRYELIGPIDSGLIDGMIRDVTKVIDQRNAKHVIFYIDTDGGELVAAQRGASFIRELWRDRGVGTYAFIPPRGRAISAGAMLAFSCTQVFMGSDTKLETSHQCV